MITRGGAVHRATCLLPRFTSTLSLGDLQKSEAQLLQHAHAELANDLNLAVSSRKNLAQRRNGPMLPVAHTGNIRPCDLPKKLKTKTLSPLSVAKTASIPAAQRGRAKFSPARASVDQPVAWGSTGKHMGKAVRKSRRERRKALEAGMNDKLRKGGLAVLVGPETSEESCSSTGKPVGMFAKESTLAKERRTGSGAEEGARLKPTLVGTDDKLRKDDRAASTRSKTSEQASVAVQAKEVSPTDESTGESEMEVGATAGEPSEPAQSDAIEEVMKDAPPHFGAGDDAEGKMSSAVVQQGTIVADEVPITGEPDRQDHKLICLEVKAHREMHVARLRSQLSRILFSPGVHPMHDPRTGVWNFEETSLHKIPQPDEFAFDRIPSYISPSSDKELSDLAKEQGCLFTGSTSTLTKALSQIYFALSGGKGVDLNTLSQAFAFEKTDYTAGASLPASIIIGKKENGQYYVDSDKQWDVENVLSEFGLILEKMLTTEKEDFARYLNSNPPDAKTKEDRTRREAYRYQKSTTLLMRSQLDCYDPRLPGTGIFDIKTRACLPIRFDRANYIANSAYDISKDRGYKQSYEKEYYDLLRAGMLKFSFQVRIGAMDGIFVAYHNTARIYGFQYLPLTELDERLFGSSEMADQAFKLCVSLLEILLAEAVKAFPDQEIELTIKRTDPWRYHRLGAFVQPRHWDAANGLRPTRLISLSLQNLLDGQKVAGPIGFSVDEEKRRDQKWSVKYTLSASKMDAASQAAAGSQLAKTRSILEAMMYVALPEGKTKAEMRNQVRGSSRNLTDKDVKDVKWRSADGKVLLLRQEAKESGEAYEQRRATWKKDQKSWVPV